VFSSRLPSGRDHRLVVAQPPPARPAAGEALVGLRPARRRVGGLSATAGIPVAPGCDRRLRAGRLSANL